MSASMTIALRNLRFHSFHGWHDEEAKTGNEFEVEAFLTITPGEIIQELDETVNYVKAYEIVKTEMAQPQKLLETLVMQIGERLQVAFPHLQKVEINIKKLTAPIPNFTGSVGVSYTKEF